LPCGSLCAERAAIARAASEGYAAADIVAVAALDPDDKLNPLWPCEVCQSWLAKLRKEADISVLAFTSTTCDSFHVCKDWVPKLIAKPALKVDNISSRNTKSTRLVGSNARSSRLGNRRRHGGDGPRPCHSAQALRDQGNLPQRLEGLSRTLAMLLRHRGNFLGMQFQEDGFVRLSDLMQVEIPEIQRAQFEDIEVVVRESYSGDHPRFEFMEEQPGVWYIRATDKHTLTIGAPLKRSGATTSNVVCVDSACGMKQESTTVEAIPAEDGWYVFQSDARIWFWRSRLVDEELDEEWFFEDEAATNGWQKFLSDGASQLCWWSHEQSGRWFQDPRNRLAS